MPRPKKDSVALNIKIDKSVSELLTRYCEEVGQTKTMAIERMLQNELERYFEQVEGKRVPR